jgi:hypothetical protein
LWGDNDAECDTWALKLDVGFTFISAVSHDYLLASVISV